MRFRVGKKMIILAGPSTGKSEVCKKYPSVFVDQDAIMRTIDASYFRRMKDVRSGLAKEDSEYLESMDRKFIKEALAAVREEKNVLLSRITKEMLIKLFAAIPNGKLHLAVYREDPNEILSIMKERDGDTSITGAVVQKWVENARSSLPVFAENIIWLKRGQYLEDVLDIPGAKIDQEVKDSNTASLKEAEEEARRENVEFVAKEGDADGKEEY